jgi:hypothetical protein
VTKLLNVKWKLSSAWDDARKITEGDFKLLDPADLPVSATVTNPAPARTYGQLSR